GAPGTSGGCKGRAQPERGHENGAAGAVKSHSDPCGRSGRVHPERSETRSAPPGPTQWTGSRAEGCSYRFALRPTRPTDNAAPTGAPPGPWPGNPAVWRDGSGPRPDAG